MRVLVDHWLVEGYVNPANRVDHLDEPTESNLDVAVDAQVSGLFNCLNEQLRSAHRVGSIELVVMMPGNTQERISRQGDEDILAFWRHVEQQHGVGAQTGFGAGAQLLLLPGREVLPLIGADQQYEGARVICASWSVRGGVHRSGMA